MSIDERSWWPEGYRHPAFEVKRRRVSFEAGGDYVRGSGGYHVDGDDESPTTELPTTALRFPTRAFEPSAFDLTARGLLFAQAYDYDTIKIVWHMPIAVYDTFTEMSIVRSSYGAPVEPMQGQTILRRKRSQFATVDDRLVPPVIYDQVVAPKVPDKSRPGELANGILPSGCWYYYTAFFTTNDQDWAPLMSDQCLLPRDYGHSEHLWNAMPPYYQWVDESYKTNDFLRRFLTIIGFELDRTREYVESLLELHRVDQCPISLLKHLGNNYGLAYQEGLGDVRYRALMANLCHMLSTRGTAKGLLELIETASKYDADVTQGVNNMLTVDDSNFLNGLGHWAPLHPDIPFTITDTTWLPYDQVLLTLNEPDNPFPPAGDAPGSGGSMMIDTADATTLDNVFITAGAGKRGTEEFIPYYHGIPIKPGSSYGFSVWIQAEDAVEVVCYLIPFTALGQIINVCSSGPFPGLVEVRPDAPDQADWFRAYVVGTMPDDCEYVVPGLLFRNRGSTGGAAGRSPRINIAAAMAYLIQVQGDVAVPPPSGRYLTLGDPVEVIGSPTEARPPGVPSSGEPYDGFVIGEP